MHSLSELINLLSLEKINDHTFIGNNYQALGAVFLEAKCWPNHFMRPIKR